MKRVFRLKHALDVGEPEIVQAEFAPRAGESRSRVPALPLRWTREILPANRHKGMRLYSDKPDTLWDYYNTGPKGCASRKLAEQLTGWSDGVLKGYDVTVDGRPFQIL